MWSYFDRIYCINLDHRTDRWSSSLTEFNRVGIEAQRFSAYTGDNKHLAFNKSQHECLKKALKDGCETFLILEDDVEFRSHDHLKTALAELPNDWDILYLGANLIGSDVMNFKKPVRTGQYVARLFDCWQTHAVGYSRAMAEEIVKRFNPSEFPIYDEWLRVNVLKDRKAFIVNPQIAVQRPGFSDIWQQEADYTGCFQQGNNRLAS